MPVAQGGRAPARQAIILGLGAAAAALAVVFIVTQMGRLISPSSSPSQFGDAVVSPGKAETLAEIVVENGPLLLPDATGGSKDIWLHHIGEDPNEGWYAFAVRPLKAQLECFADWQPDSQTFVDTCDETTYPETGDGLRQYLVSITDEGDLTINLL